MRIVKILAITMLVMFVASDAFAERRAGLGGKFAARHMTAAQGSLTVIAGPDSAQLLGGSDGGISYLSLGIDCPEPVAGVEIDCPDDPMNFNIGAAYGITPELEAGLLLPLQLSPETDLTMVPVFATYAKDMGNFDIGGRLTVNVPIAEGMDFSLAAGVPVLFRFNGKMRLDTGLFLPVTFADETVIGLNVPVRFGMNFTPKVFAGLETGVRKTSLDGENDLFLPLGFFGGYTMLAGGRVIDIGLSMTWDGFMALDAPEGADAMNTDLMRINAGANVQMQF